MWGRLRFTWVKLGKFLEKEQLEEGTRFQNAELAQLQLLMADGACLPRACVPRGHRSLALKDSLFHDFSLSNYTVS